MHAAFIGASRGIGYQALLLLLAQPNFEATLLLRSPSTFDNNSAIAPHIQSGRVRVIQGDATVEADVSKLFDKKVDALITSVGGKPHFTLSGFGLDDPTVCTRAAVALVNALGKVIAPPRVIAISSMGIGAEHHIMPLALRIVYPWMLSGPHRDKEGLEYVLQSAATALPTPTTDFPPTEILSETGREAVPKNVIPEIVIVRPALLTDGESRGIDKIRADEKLSTYTISRKDVALFVVEKCLPGNDEWLNRTPVVGY